MGQVLLLLVVALTVAAVVFGVTVLVSGRDPGLVPVEPDGRAVPLPGARPLRESDVGEVRFDTALRGYRMAQVDQAMRRAAYDIGYKSELIGVLEAEVTALREGRIADADALRRAREQAAGSAAQPEPPAAGATGPIGPGGPPVAEPTGPAVSEPVVYAEPAPTGRDAFARPTSGSDAFARPTTATGTAGGPAGAATDRPVTESDFARPTTAGEPAAGPAGAATTSGTAATGTPGAEAAPATGNGARPAPAGSDDAPDSPGEPEDGRRGPVARSEPV
ncbi:DivIVA domain-containing protein [Micromonospora echinaurantiaca]|uniref:DivIVA domain-containing protein n=1 Tax=Micromonospora echinaurantiaca TaxID=47857 RepID=A0A1C5KCI7_9ACTN|nr:DivIVA domain-containing protein [Micromonospora echinaurantiaca]